MDEPGSQNVNNDGTTPVHPENDPRPVVWTPEDASRFLTSAIYEAQKPLADALKHRPITTSTLVLVLFVILAAAAGTGWILFTQLEKTERIADTARSGMDGALLQQHQLQSRSDTLQARLEAAQAAHEQLSAQFQQESESLRSQVEGKRDNEEELRRIQTELARFRRQNELLKSQISGLEMEKQALARQLDAVRAMADDGFDIPPGGLTDEETAEPFPEPPAHASPLSDSLETFDQEPPSAEAPPLTAEPETPAEPAAEPEAEAAALAEAAEQSGPAMPIQPEEDAADDQADTEEEEPAIEITATPEPATSTVAVQEIAGEESETGTLTAGENGGNPPTLYESSQANLTDGGGSAADAREEIAITGAISADSGIDAEMPEEAEPASEAETAAVDKNTVQYSEEMPVNREVDSDVVDTDADESEAPVAPEDSDAATGNEQG